MKVLFLVSRYGPHGIGGAERVAATLARSLGDQGHEIVVLTTEFEGDPPERTLDGIRVRSIPLRNVYDFAQPGPRALKPLWHLIDSSNPMMKAAVAAVIREERPDVIHSHLITGFSPSAWDAAAGEGIPIVHTLHDHYVICARSSMARRGIPCTSRHLDCALLSRPRIRAARRVDAVVGVSRYILERHREFGAFTSNRSFVIPNPCHLVRNPEPGPPPDAVRSGSVRFGFLGRLEVNKGIDRLLAASVGLASSGWTLSVAGSGEAHHVSRLRREFESPRISFVGQVDTERFLSQIDALVVPSTSPETFGMAAAEALAMGVPVLASTVAALPELIEDGRNGFLFNPFEEGALQRLLARIVADPMMIAGKSDACRASVSALAPAQVARRYAEVYESL
jgi:glycosyltransferase involved in cell wall biosynthesis